MDSAELEELIAEGEGPLVEFKSARLRPEVVAKVVGAFANTRGGTLIWGVGDDGRVLGVDDPDLAERAIRQGIALVWPPPEAAVDQTEVEGKTLMVVRTAPQPGRLHLADG